LRETERVQAGEGAEGEGQADSTLSAEPRGARRSQAYGLRHPGAL